MANNGSPTGRFRLRAQPRNIVYPHGRVYLEKEYRQTVKRTPTTATDFEKVWREAAAVDIGLLGDLLGGESGFAPARVGVMEATSPPPVKHAVSRLHKTTNGFGADMYVVTAEGGQFKVPPGATIEFDTLNDTATITHENGAVDKFTSRGWPIGGTIHDETQHVSREELKAPAADTVYDGQREQSYIARVQVKYPRADEVFVQSGPYWIVVQDGTKDQTGPVLGRGHGQDAVARMKAWEAAATSVNPTGQTKRQVGKPAALGASYSGTVKLDPINEEALRAWFAGNPPARGGKPADAYNGRNGTVRIDKPCRFENSGDDVLNVRLVRAGQNDRLYGVEPGGAFEYAPQGRCKITRANGEISVNGGPYRSPEQIRQAAEKERAEAATTALNALREKVGGGWQELLRHAFGYGFHSGGLVEPGKSILRFDEVPAVLFPGRDFPFTWPEGTRSGRWASEQPARSNAPKPADLIAEVRRRYPGVNCTRLSGPSVNPWWYAVAPGNKIIGKGQTELDAWQEAYDRPFDVPGATDPAHVRETVERAFPGARCNCLALGVSRTYTVVAPSGVPIAEGPTEQLAWQRAYAVARGWLAEEQARAKVKAGVHDAYAQKCDEHGWHIVARGGLLVLGTGVTEAAAWMNAAGPK